VVAAHNSQRRRKGSRSMSEETQKKVKLKLEGIDGNAFSVMGAWSRAARRQGWTTEEIGSVLTNATSGDYNHLLYIISSHSETPEDE